MLDSHGFITFLKNKGYYVREQSNKLWIEQGTFFGGYTVCWVYLTEGKIVSFCWEHLIESPYEEFLSLFTTETLLKFPESGSMKIFTLITGIKDE